MLSTVLFQFLVVARGTAGDDVLMQQRWGNLK